MSKLSPSYTILAYTSMGTLTAYGRAAASLAQRPGRVNDVRFEWLWDGQLWRFVATLRGQAEDGFSDLEDAVFIACYGAGFRVDRKSWEPDPEAPEAMLWNGARLAFRNGEPVEVEVDDNLNDDPEGSTARLVEAMGVKIGPWSRIKDTFKAAVLAA